MTEPLSLVEAHINVSTRILELITSLSSVRILTLTCQTMRGLIAIPIFIRNRPRFPNLVKLVIGINGSWEWNFLLDLLDRMPNLEHITFSDGLLCIDQIYNQKCNLPTPMATCLLSNVKAIVLLNFDAVIWEEFAFIRYLLNNAKKLETLTISAPNICHKKREEILKFSRGSKFCRIEFI
ncbi:F-box/FBD/LRR-repeat protein At3g26920-like [Rutidosis leptorrhynchoides]|uniref:F-box/FBD/LRR-repeat protein At3g26920-like n=1 Tax=Rutidosis leptorrhynchoides TaxID=125765 RepID=UPI003A999DCA